MRQLSSSPSEPDSESQGPVLKVVPESLSDPAVESVTEHINDSVAQTTPTEGTAIRRRHFRRNVIGGALGVSVLPTLIVGAIATASYQQLLEQVQPSKTQPALVSQQTGLYVTTGAVAVLAGAIATLLAYQSLRPLRLATLATNRLVQQIKRGESDTDVPSDQDELDRLEANLKIIAAQTLKLRSQRAVQSNPTPDELTDQVFDPSVLVEFIDANGPIIHDLSQTAFCQTKQVDAIYSDLVTITTAAQEIQADVQQGVERSQSLSQAAQVGQQTVDQVKDHHASMWVSLIEAATKVQSLSQPVERLDQILHHVGTLTANVKLKAMNAALEAARIGELGEGFANIGEDLHTLVRQLDEGMAEIDSLMSDLKTEVQSAAAKMTLGQQQASSGKLLMVVAGQQLNQIMTLISQLEAGSEQITQRVTGQVQTCAIASQNMVDVATLTSQVTEQAALLAEAMEQLPTQDC
ncbi:MAG: methyl-accepting chemotaxis protein [Thermosynechococcaceae cyanobacterium]